MGARGRKPMPKVVEGGPAAFRALPRCPPHLNAIARKEWRRLASALHSVGILTVVDRAALAAYCQAWARWVEAEEHLAKGPPLIKTPSGYVQQSPWLTVANKQLEIMGRFMAELGLSPSARARLRLPGRGADDSTSIKIITLIAAENEGESNPDRLPVNVTVSER